MHERCDWALVTNFFKWAVILLKKKKDMYLLSSQGLDYSMEIYFY